MREIRTSGSMSGAEKPGMVVGIEAGPERSPDKPPWTWSHGALPRLYKRCFEIEAEGICPLARRSIAGGFGDSAPIEQRSQRAKDPAPGPNDFLNGLPGLGPACPRAIRRSRGPRDLRTRAGQRPSARARATAQGTEPLRAGEMVSAGERHPERGSACPRP